MQMEWLKTLASLSLTFKDSVSLQLIFMLTEKSIRLHASTLGQDLNSAFYSDGCPSEEIDGFIWPESDLNLLGPIHVSCTCGNLDTTMLNLQAVRNCKGSYTDGASWMGPGKSTACRLSSAAINLCALYDVSCNL